MTDTTPAPVAPPTFCPACCAPIKKQFYIHEMLCTNYECGYTTNLKGGKITPNGNDCTRAFDAAIQLRSTVAALTARVKELETDYAALEYLDHEASIGASEVGRQVKELQARAEKAEAERDADKEHREKGWTELHRVSANLNAEIDALAAELAQARAQVAELQTN